MRALVTGGAGFIGSRLSRALAERGDDVVIIDSLTDYYDPDIKRRNLRGLDGLGIEVLEDNLLEADLASLVEVDAIFHLAGQPGVRASWGADFDTYVAANVLATQRLLEAVRDSGADPAVVLASSSSIYGDAEAYPTSEATIPRPVSPYGVTKLAAESLAAVYARNFRVRTVSLRYFTVYGPGQRPDMAFTRFILAALRGEPIPLFGDGAQVRDFTYVDDVVRATILAATTEIGPGTCLNVSGGSETTVSEVISMVAELCGRPVAVDRQPAVSGDVVRTGGDHTKIAALTGWAPQVSLREGLDAQVRWARDLVEAAPRP